MKKLSKLLLMVVCLALVVGAQAQTFRGRILGTVSDQTGAVVPGAKVTVRNVDTGLERTTETDDTGFYLVPELPIGSYSVTVEASGFQTAIASGLRVEVAVDRRVDITLQPGAVTEVAEVVATVPLVETTSNVLGGSFESKQVLDLPINGRDFTKLLIMVPGATGEPNAGGDSPGSFGLFSVNGNRGRSNNFLLDGTDMNDGYRNLPAINQGGVFGTPGTVLPVEAIAEVRILSSFEPEYGRNSGSVVNIVTKSGTNDLHGSVFEYFRNDKLNARNFYNHEPGSPKDKFRNNQFGASVGGPIVKDKTFWYFTYEGQRERLGVTSVNDVPTLNDFAVAIGELQGLLPPGTPAPGCTTTILACLQNNQSDINPVILNLFNFCATNGGCSGDRQVWPASTVSSAPAFNDVDSLIVKIDHNFNDRNHLSGRYFFGDSAQSFPLGLAGGNNLPNTNTFSPIRTQLLSVSYVHVYSSTMVNETRFGWNLYEQDFFAADRAVFGNPNTSIGLNNGVTRMQDFGLPAIRVSGLSGLGSSGYSNPRGRDDTNWHLIDNFSWKLARHDLKFGYEFRRTTVNSFNDFHQRSQIGFGSLEDFLAGSPTGFSFQVQGNTARRARQNSHAGYLQDSWRLRSDFTLILGLRYEFFGPISEAGGQFSLYDPAQGLVLRNPPYGDDWNNFSPRVAFAWDVGGTGKTVIRGGAGMFYDIFSQDFFTGQIFFNSFNAGPAYNAIGSNPVFISFSPDLTLAVGDQVFDTGTFASDTTDAATVDPNLRTPYVMTWNLNVQRELTRDTVVQVGYVGSAGRKLFRFRDINQPSQAEITAADLACDCIDFVPRPFDSAAVLSSQAPNAPFYVNQIETSSSSAYHGLQAQFTQRNWRGLTQQVAYTWAHSIDDASDGQDFVPNAAQPNDSRNARNSNRGNSNFDTRQRFVYTFTYDLPHWGALGKFGEGWQLSGVLTFMSGHPFHLNYNFIGDYDGSGEFFGRPDIIAAARYNRSDPFQFLDLSSFRVPCTLDLAGDGTDAFCTPGTRHFGSLGRNSLIGPDYRNFDIALIKNHVINDRLSLQFRLDTFNLTNHPNFANPYLPAFIADAAPNFDPPCDAAGVQPTSGVHCGFLGISATSDVGLGNPILAGGGPRSLQLTVKFIF